MQTMSIAIGKFEVISEMIVSEGKIMILSLIEISSFYCCRTPIKCDSVVRLFHVTTRRNLHSHNYQSPLSNNQEVSAYGEDGVGDEGDRWKVVCTTKNDYWLRADPVRFQHVVTGK